MTRVHMSPCPGCARHVRVSEIGCPFCQIPLSDEFRAQTAPSPPARRLGRAALAALGAAGTIAVAGACSSAVYGAPPVDAGTDTSPTVDAAYGAPPVDGGIQPLYGAPPQDTR